MGSRQTHWLCPFFQLDPFLTAFEMRIALLAPSLDDLADPLTLSHALSPVQRMERHLKKMGHRTARFETQALKEDLFVFEEFIKVEDVEFTVVFGSPQGLFHMNQHIGDFALFFTFSDLLDLTQGSIAGQIVNALHRAKALIADDLRAYHMLLERAWPMKRRIHYIGKAVLPVPCSAKRPLNDLPIPPCGRWFLLNQDQQKASDALLDLFASWHRSDPNIYLLAPLTNCQAPTSRQIAKIVNRNGVIEMAELPIDAYFAAIKGSLGAIDPSSHPGESLATQAVLKMGKPILIDERASALLSKRSTSQLKSDQILTYKNEGNLLRLCQTLDRDRIFSEKMQGDQSHVFFQDANRECQEYERLFARLLAK